MNHHASPALPGQPASPETSEPPQPMRELDIATLRQQARDHALAAAGDPEGVASVEEIRANGVPARLYRPAGGERAVLVWLHGDGWILGDPACYDTMARAVANRACCAVLSVDYRLAPEHRYPAAGDDSWDATRWASAQFDQVPVGGDGAGGNLAAAVALRARDHALLLALQLLIYPVLDDDSQAPYQEDFATRHNDSAGPDALETQRDNMEYIWQEYVPDPARRLEPGASPVRAVSLAGLAPALFITAGRDIRRAETREYARRLAADGVPVRRGNYPAASHGFYHLLAATPCAGDAVGRSAALRGAFSEHQVSGPAPQRRRTEPQGMRQPRISS